MSSLVVIALCMIGWSLPIVVQSIREAQRGSLGAVVSAVLLLPIVLVASGSSTQGRPTRQSSMRRPSTGDGGGTAVVGRSVDAVLDVAAPAPVLSRTVARTHSAAPGRPTNGA